MKITDMGAALDPQFERVSDTPRTDALEIEGYPCNYVNANFARYLERKLVTAGAELAKAKAQRDKAIAFLHVYRNDTPLGHQPHMIAHDVDQFLKESGK